MNAVTITGHVGSDPEVRVGQSGKKRVTFNVAVTNGQGDNQRTDWIPVTVFNGPSSTQADNIAGSVKRGTRVTVTGRLDTYVQVLQKDGADVNITRVQVLATEVGIGLLTQQAAVSKVHVDHDDRPAAPASNGSAPRATAGAGARSSGTAKTSRAAAPADEDDAF